MLNLMDIFRRSTSATEAAYSSDEVLAILRGDELDERAETALEVITRPSKWLPPDHQRRFGNLAWYAERLPTILHLYRRGWEPGQIGRRLTPLGGAWAVERTLDLAANLIAECLNTQALAA